MDNPSSVEDRMQVRYEAVETTSSTSPTAPAPSQYRSPSNEMATNVQQADLAVLSLSNISKYPTQLHLQNKSAKLELARLKAEFERIRVFDHIHFGNILERYGETAELHRIPMSTLKSPVIHEQLNQYLDRHMKSQSRAGFRLPSAYVQNIKKWFVCLASGLSFLHDHKICHGGLNPTNIICQDDHIYYSVLDISQKGGVAERKHAGPQYMHLAYAAPESSSTQNSSFDILSSNDVFSLGLVYTDMLTKLVGGNVEDLRKHLHAHELGDKVYHRRLQELDEWFLLPRPLISPPEISAHGMYTDCFAFMLRWRGHLRPTAADVLEILLKRGNDLLGPIASCDCTIRVKCQSSDPESGWQVGKEHLLWDAAADTPLEVTERGTLGRGRIGEVEEVIVPGFGIPIARKRIFIPRCKAPGAFEKTGIRTEIENLRSLDHQHIVKVLGCYREPAGRLSANFYVLLHPSGESDLRVFLEETYKNASGKQQELYASWIRKWFTCLSSALAYMHYSGIHHEDIKPANIIRRGDTVYFTDFSSSRKIESWQETSTESPAAATRLFSAPEAFYEGGEISRHGSKTDVFSLGLVFVEMLTVLTDREVEDLRNFVFKQTKGQRQYHRVRQRFDRWFGDTKVADQMYSRFLIDMLMQDRKERASAQSIADRFKKSLRSDRACGCHWLRWEKRVRPGEQQSVQDDEDDGFVLV